MSGGFFVNEGRRYSAIAILRSQKHPGSITGLFIVLCLVTFSIHYISLSVLFNDDVYYDFYSDRLTYEKIGTLLELKNKWEWLFYPFLIIFLYLKLLIVAAILYVAVLLTDYHRQDFKSLFKIALLGEFIFLFQPLLRLIWYGIFQPDYSLKDLQNFVPFSLLGLMDQTSINQVLVYPLTILNILEVVYVVILSQLVSEKIDSGFSVGLKIVLGSYGTGLVLWVLCITFMTVSLS